MSGTTGTVLDPRIVAMLQQYGQQPANTTNPNAAGYTPPHQGPVAPGTPYTGPQPLFAGGYNTLAPSDFANYKASLQAPDPNWQAPQQQQLPGLLDNDAAQIAQAKKLFDNPNGYWSGGEGAGGNGGGQR